MAKLSTIDIAYEYLKNKKDRADFKEIWAVIKEKNGSTFPNENAIMANLYTGLVCDNRFSLTPDGAWALRNNSKFEDLKKQYSNVAILKDDTLDDSFEDDETTKFFIDDDDDDDDNDDDVSMTTFVTKDEDSFEDTETL